MNQCTPLPWTGALRSPEAIARDSEQLPHWLTHEGLLEAQAERNTLYKSKLANNGSNSTGNALWQSLGG